MSGTLLAVQSYAAANAMVERHWPFWRESGCDILGVGRTDSKCVWPEPIQTVDIGSDLYTDKDNLCRRLIDTFRHCLTLPYDDFCVIECDCVNIGKLPSMKELDLGIGFLTHRAGCGSDGFKGNQYFHCPWWADRATAELIVQFGDQMLSEGDIEQGWPDRFIGWLFERFNLPWNSVRGYSENTIEGEASIKRARAAVEAGVRFIHGIKTKEVLDQVIQGGNYLDRLALQHGTDKSSVHHGYCDVYQKYFEPIRWKVKAVLEIGVLGGASLRMWKGYFPNAEITGFDVEDRGFASEHRIQFHKRNAHDPAMWSTIPPNSFDCICDDGSHTALGMIEAFKGAFRCVVSGGLYIIEDTHACYDPQYNRDGYPNAMDYYKGLLDELNDYGNGQCGKPSSDARIAFIHFYRSLIIIGKA